LFLLFPAANGPVKANNDSGAGLVHARVRGHSFSVEMRALTLSCYMAKKRNTVLTGRRANAEGEALDALNYAEPPQS